MLIGTVLEYNIRNQLRTDHWKNVFVIFLKFRMKYQITSKQLSLTVRSKQNLSKSVNTIGCSITTLQNIHKKHSVELFAYGVCLYHIQYFISNYV